MRSLENSEIEDEIELIDLLRIIWSRRKLIILTTLVFMVISGGITQMRPDRYETTALIQIGRVWEKEIENPYLTREWMESDAFLLQVIEKLHLDTTPRQIQEAVRTKVLEKGASGRKKPLLLSVQVFAETPQQPVNIAETIVTLVIEKHRLRFEEWFHEYQVYEEGLSHDVARIEKAIRDLEVLVKKQQMAPVVNAPSVILLQSQLEQKNVQLLEFKRELQDTRLSNNSKVITENTRLIAPPIIPTEPLGSGIVLFVSVAGVLGFFGTVLLSFLLEYLKQVQLKESLNKS